MGYKTGTAILMMQQFGDEVLRNRLFVKSLDPAQAMDWKEAHTPSKEEVERALRIFEHYSDILNEEQVEPTPE